MKIKTLEQRKQALEGKLACYRADLKSINQKISNVTREISKVNDEIKLIKHPVGITDHAVLRYMERVLGVDVENIRALMLEESKDAVKFVQSGKIEKENYTLVVEDKKVITVLPAHN